MIRVIPQSPKRTRRDCRKARKSIAVSSAPVLVSATYDKSDFLYLVFDRAVDIENYNGSGVFVDDSLYLDARLVGVASVTLVSPCIVEIGLNLDGSAQGPGVHLTAPATTGIVALDDGAPWEGVIELELPFNE